MHSLRSRLTTKTFAVTAAIFVASLGASAQTTDTIVVFDGSGSMWGQINGRTKIEIARETLSSVLTEVPAETRIGMIAYGHRQKGVCADIETVVPVGPASQSVPRMIDVANQLRPKGKTPLSDAVRIASEELRFTENAATVILVTDGIETCDADPCALATELENAGVGFTAHVIGFGLSKEEGQQVQCLADNTGGLYLSANDADELSDALRRTVQAQPIEPDPVDFGPAITTRDVRFIFRDSEEGEQIGIRQLQGLVERADGSPIDPDAFQFAYPEAQGNSATATLEPGQYVALLTRNGAGGSGYSVRFAFEVPEGEGEHIIEASLSGSLTIKPFINPNLPYSKGDDFPTAVGGSRPRFNFYIYSVRNGQKAEEPEVVIKGTSDLTRPLGPGTYLIQGNLDSGTSAEMLVEVEAGGPTIVDFSFDATRVYIDAREADGAPVRKRQTTFFYDTEKSGRNYWVRGGGAPSGGLSPFYLPTGKWLVNVGGEGYGSRRSERIITVPGDFQDLRIQVGEGEVLSEADLAFLRDRGNGCLEILKVNYAGCLVKRADLSVGASASSSSDMGLQDQAQTTPKPTPGSPTDTAPQPLSLEERINRVFGVFSFDDSGLPIDEVVADYFHVNRCQRSQVVIWPDGTFARKRFVDPQGSNENPFKTVALGQCQISGTRYECNVTDKETGKSEYFAFSSRSLGKNHYQLTFDDQATPINAASCYFPGGEADANAPTPLGRTMSELILERADGQAPGMGYDKNNNIYGGN